MTMFRSIWVKSKAKSLLLFFFCCWCLNIFLGFGKEFKEEKKATKRKEQKRKMEVGALLLKGEKKGWLRPWSHFFFFSFPKSPSLKLMFNQRKKKRWVKLSLLNQYCEKKNFFLFLFSSLFLKLVSSLVFTYRKSLANSRKTKRQNPSTSKCKEKRKKKEVVFLWLVLFSSLFWKLVPSLVFYLS